MNKLIIIPTYNESEVIREIISAIFKVSPDVDVLIVDDNSPDGTGSIVDNLAKLDSRTKCLHRAGKEGIGPAYIDGFKWAIKNGYQYIMQMDADFSHDPKYIPEFFNLINNNDIVIGSRYIPGGSIKNWGIIRRFVSRCGSIYPRIMLDLPVSDPTSGFKCLASTILQRIDLDKIFTRGYAFQIETIYKAYKKGARLLEIPIIFTDRRVGKTKMTWDIFFEAIFSVLRLARED